ncbi:cytochrome P450 [Fomes fomentarius]|nr:cytochrome P450 [Fomes fomentarius]
MPKSRVWLGFRNLCAEYGNVVCLRVLNQSVVILGDPAVILAFMDRRSANTSSRVQTPSFSLTGHDWNWAFLPYGQSWRHHRRMFWQHFNPGAIDQYKPVQQAFAHQFLHKLLENTGELKDHIQLSISSVILKITYGVDIADKNDSILLAINVGILGTRQILVSGGFLVDYIHFLRHVPSFLPGGGFQKKFAKWRVDSWRQLDAPFDRYLEAVKDNGNAPHCVVADIIASCQAGNENQLPIYDPHMVAKSVAGVTFEAGSETTASTLQVFFLAMSLYPSVRKKAQAELDTVVGNDRLPEFGDRDALVYVNAIIKECLRWFSVLPVGLSHSTIEDDELQGYFIPAGTMLIGNIWACMHDPDVYEDPTVFRPERFIRDGKLDPDVTDPGTFVFGFGRRSCPGRHFADATLFINIASVLHVFDITPPLDENGKEIKIEMTMTDGFSSQPEDCRCTIKPRGAWAEALVSGYAAEQEMG